VVEKLVVYVHEQGVVEVLHTWPHVHSRAEGRGYTGSVGGSMVVVQDTPVVGMEGSMVLAEVDSKGLAEVGSTVLEVGSMVLVEVGSTARGLALGTAGNTPAGDKLAEGELVHEQAHAGVEVVGQHRDCKAEVQDRVQDIAGDRAGRPAADIQAQGMVGG